MTLSPEFGREFGHALVTQLEYKLGVQIDEQLYFSPRHRKNFDVLHVLLRVRVAWPISVYLHREYDELR